MRKRLHFAFMIFTEFTDVNATLALVEVLVRRGTRVTYVTSDRFSTVVTSLGAEFICCPPHKNPLIYKGQGSSENDFIQANLQFNVEMLSAVTHFYKENRPDLIIHDYMTLAGRILAKELGVRTAQVGPDFAFDRSSESTQAPEFYRAVREISDKYLNPFLSNYGIEGDSWFFYRADLNIYFYPRVFQLGNAHRDEERFFYAGRCSPERPHVPRWRPRKSDYSRLVLITTSTAYVRGPEYFRMCMNALKDLEWHIVLAIDNNDPDEFQPLPDNVEIFKGIPQVEVMPYADLIITSGGIITTMEAMYHGIPLLMMTHGFIEAAAYADNNVRLGLGKHIIKKDTNESNVRRLALEILQDTEILTRVAAMKEVIRRDAGAEEAANRISHYVESGR